MTEKAPTRLVGVFWNKENTEFSDKQQIIVNIKGGLLLFCVMICF